jgi:cell division protein FtsB
MDWISLISFLILGVSFLVNLYGTRNKTLREKREDTYNELKDLRERVMQLERRLETLEEENAQLRKENYKLYQRINN